MQNQPTAQSAQTEREKYILAWNDTMINIWKEQITLRNTRFDKARSFLSVFTQKMAIMGR